MKPKIMILILGVLFATAYGCRKQTDKYTLVSDRPWSVGEARTCSFDGKWKEGHCFQPKNVSDTNYKYLVDIDFDRPLHFDDQQWAGLNNDITCRLDSFEHATCHTQP
jgi:hypothetical protein